MQPLKKIVVIGPESTGKSTLCEKLSQHYNTLWIPEFARQFLEEHGTKYTFEDLLTIAKTQIRREEDYINGGIRNKELEIRKHSPFTGQPPMLFIDTDMYVMKVWCEFVFDKCHNWILDQVAIKRYDLYLLCNIDVPWAKDELREYPDLATRTKLYHYYKDIMINQATPWVDISGTYEQRFNEAVNAIDSLSA